MVLLAPTREGYLSVGPEGRLGATEHDHLAEDLLPNLVSWKDVKYGRTSLCSRWHTDLAQCTPHLVQPYDSNSASTYRVYHHTTPMNRQAELEWSGCIQAAAWPSLVGNTQQRALSAGDWNNMKSYGSLGPVGAPHVGSNRHPESRVGLGAPCTLVYVCSLRSSS